MTRVISTRRLLQRAATVSIATSTLLATVACGNSSVPVETPSPTVPFTSTTSPTVTTAPSTPASPSQTWSESAKASPTTTTSPVGPKTPVTSRTESSRPTGESWDPPTPLLRATLLVGETARLANWEVTVLKGEPGEDGISYGWKVKVCYVAHSPLEKDGRVYVSDNAWSFIVQDQEGGWNPIESIPVGAFERDHTYRPDYVNTTLALGECNLGWIGIVHGNPDLGWLGVEYEPSTGEGITWKW